MTGCHAESSQRLAVTAADAEMAMRARAMVCTAAAMEQREQFARSWYREGGCLLLQRPSGQQVEADPHLSDGHHRVGAAAITSGGLAVGTHQDREKTFHSVEGPGDGPAEGAAISHRSLCSN
jgi:hypothetical protein